MTQEFVVGLAAKTLYYTLLISGPILATGLVVGILVALFQSVTQLKEMTLTFIPKITAVMLVLLFTIPWMVNKFLEYVHYLFDIIGSMH